MNNIMRFKVLYFIFSFLIILPGLYFLLTSGLKLGIDFSGGALLEYRFGKNINTEELRQTVVKDGIEVGGISSEGNNTYLIRISKKSSYGKKIVIKNASTMKKAVFDAYRTAVKGDIVLLSPGAASFGLFLHEFDRGDQFIKAVHALSKVTQKKV